jgi:hypothetical protein
MSGTLIAITGFIYLYVAVEQLYRGNTGMFLTYCGYAFANVGLWMMAR